MWKNDRGEPVWIHYEAALAIHRRLLAEYGGLADPVDLKHLKQALDAPRVLFLQKQKKVLLSELAACYAFSVLKRSPFPGGNKRVALVLSELFLRINGTFMRASKPDKFKFISKLSTSIDS